MRGGTGDQGRLPGDDTSAKSRTMSRRKQARDEEVREETIQGKEIT